MRTTRLGSFITAALIVCSLLQTRAAVCAQFQERGFYDVLQDTLADFEYDLKHGTVVGLPDLSIRDLSMSENVPKSFRSHLEQLITERILRTTKTKVIQCVACRARRTMLNDDNIEMTSPRTNPAELSRIAKMGGIQHFMDVAFAYQPTGMVMSITVTEPETGSVVWSRSYNSETSRASLARRGIAMEDADPSTRQATEYAPTLQYRATVDYLFEPNVGGTTGCVGVGFRMVERYDNRKKEVGFEAEYLKDSSTLMSGGATAASTSADNLYSGVNITLLFIHGWNLIGGEEDYNKARSNVYVGAGGTYTSGFLGALLRTGYEWRLAKHFAVTANAGYRPASTAFIGTPTGTSVSGLEYGLGLSLLF